jgi:transcriptional regulator with XRE-family HTH domain
MMNEEAQVLFGAELRRRRESLGMTLEELAARAGLTPNYVGTIEMGKRDPSLSTIVELAKGLDISPGEFFPSRPGLSPSSD